MKKLRIIILVSAIMSVFLLASCQSGIDKYRKKIAEFRDDVLGGESANFTASAVTGYREEPFEINGVANAQCDFCVVTITPKNFDPSVCYKYKATVNGTEYSGDFVKHPFENTYSFEIAARCETGNMTVSVDDETIELSSVKTDEFITAEKAFETALKRLNGSDIIKSGKYEIYIRLISNPVNAAGGYFWYVAFVDENKDTCAVLIEPTTMEITAVRE